ncbi:uncharacterized protein [Cherax quadricarinatus]|uniref:uncharacterized protein isoform X3 n=1 Tax=Cherax quadricarinatus TaxID=27406 RepID=UPI002377F4E5|nr:uncharacterized protein LOC128695391 isoform X3 [Cherax quadricarinatus]
MELSVTPVPKSKDRASQHQKYMTEWGSTSLVTPMPVYTKSDSGESRDMSVRKITTTAYNTTNLTTIISNAAVSNATSSNTTVSNTTVSNTTVSNTTVSNTSQHHDVYRKGTQDLKDIVLSSKSRDANNRKNYLHNDDNKDLQCEDHTGSIKTVPVQSEDEKAETDKSISCSMDELDQYWERVLPASATPQETVNWLTANGFRQHVDTFKSFTGTDMLNFSSSDFVDICGQTDGAEIFNTLNPRLSMQVKIYVRLSSQHTHYYAVYLRQRTAEELAKKVLRLMGIPSGLNYRLYLHHHPSTPALLTNQTVRNLAEETILSVKVQHNIDNLTITFVQGQEL